MLYLNLRIAQRGLVPNPIVLQLARVGAAAQRHGGAPPAEPAGLRSWSVSWPAWPPRRPGTLVLRAHLPDAVRHRDPVFSRDIGFYVFTLPALSAALGFLSTLATLSLLAAGAGLLAARRHRAPARGGSASSRRRACTSPSCWRCCSLLTALRLWLVDIPGLLYSTTGPLVGASYTDLHARLPALRVSAVLAVLAAVAVLVGGHAAASWRRYGAAGRSAATWWWRSSGAGSSRWRCRSSSWRRPS